MAASFSGEGRIGRITRTAFAFARVWAAVTAPDGPNGAVLHLVGYKPGDKAPRDFGPVGIANPDYTKLSDAVGKPLPLHHTIRKAADATPAAIFSASPGANLAYRWLRHKPTSRGWQPRSRQRSRRRIRTTRRRLTAFSKSF